MRRALALACAGLLASHAAAMAADIKPIGSPSAAGYKPMGKDEEGLWAQADEEERAYRTSKLVVRDPRIDAYLRGVLCRTVGGDRCAATRLYLVRSSLVNAFAMPNGAMVVFTGMLLRLQNEAELAAVLGHEFAHFEHRHALDGLKSRRNAMSWAVWLTVASIGVGQGYDYRPSFAAGHFSYARDQERDADLTGLALMRPGGFRPRSAPGVWAHMRAEDDRRAAVLGSKSDSLMWRGPFATHPMNAERMNYLQAAADRDPDDISYTGAAEYRAALAPLWPMLIADQVKLNDFGGSEFLLGNLASDAWLGHLLFARGELYRTRAGPGDLEQAVGFYRTAIAKADAPAEAWRGLALASARLGDTTAARAAVAEYLRRRPEAGDRAALETIGEER